MLPIPSAHAYPLRVRQVDGDGAVTHLPDPPVPGAPLGQWWPPPALDAAWVREHADEVDVVHLHFGFDAATPADLEAWVDALREAAIPLVFTVHDLANPHFADQAEHLARLDVLVPAADAVTTLTEGAAAEIRRRWQRDAVVLPHPHVAPLDVIGMPGDRPPVGADHPFRVGLHLKSLRANVIAAPVVEAVLPGIADLPHAELVVHHHHELADPAHPRHDAELHALLQAESAAGRLRVEEHEPHSDDELWDYLRSLDVSVAAYAFGTHSGWVEACHDLGVTTLMPRTGYWVEQQDTLTFGWPSGGDPDVAEIRAALHLAHARVADGVHPTDGAARRDERAEQQAYVAREHERIYLEVTR